MDTARLSMYQVEVPVPLDSPERDEQHPRRRDDDAPSVADLIVRAREGDRTARDEILVRYLPPLRVWASGRLPSQSRPLMSTLDLVHDAVRRALGRLEKFEDRGEGALLAYLRTAILNRIRDEIRLAQRRPAPSELHDDFPARGSSPLDDAIGTETHQRYLDALATLNPRYEQAIVLHVEMGYELEELAEAIEAPTPHAARMTLRRALEQLAKAMADES